MPIFDNAARTEKQIRIFDKHRLPGERVFLLKSGQHKGSFVLVKELPGGWYPSFNDDFRDEIILRYATLDAGFVDELAQSSFLAHGTGSVGDLIDIYEFSKKDAHAPNATSPNWKIFATRKAELRFEMPASA